MAGAAAGKEYAAMVARLCVASVAVSGQMGKRSPARAGEVEVTELSDTLPSEIGMGYRGGR